MVPKKTGEPRDPSKIFSDLDRPIDSVLMDHVTDVEELAETNEKFIEESVNWAPDITDNEADKEFDHALEKFSIETKLRDPSLQQASSETPEVQRTAEQWIEEINKLTWSARESLASVQKELGSSPLHAADVLISYVGEEQQEARTLLEKNAPRWGAKIRHHHSGLEQELQLIGLEPALAYLIWKAAKAGGLNARVQQKSKANIESSDAEALSYARMTKELFGTLLPEVPLYEAEAPSGSSSSELMAEDFFVRIALPTYYNRKNAALTRSLAERLLRLKAVEKLARYVTHFAYEIKEGDGLRWLECQGKLWK